MEKGLLLPLMLFVALLSLGAQTSRDVDVFYAPLAPNYLGATICSNERIVIVLAPGLDSNQHREVLVHEKIHVRQIREFGSCRAFTIKYRASIVFRLGVEIEAYCPEARSRAVKMGVEGVVVSLSSHLVTSYGGMEHYGLVKFLVRNCLGGLNDTS